MRLSRRVVCHTCTQHTLALHAAGHLRPSHKLPGALQRLQHGERRVRACCRPPTLHAGHWRAGCVPHWHLQGGCETDPSLGQPSSQQRNVVWRHPPIEICPSPLVPTAGHRHSARPTTPAAPAATARRTHTPVVQPRALASARPPLLHPPSTARPSGSWCRRCRRQTLARWGGAGVWSLVGCGLCGWVLPGRCQEGTVCTHIYLQLREKASCRTALISPPFVPEYLFLLSQLQQTEAEMALCGTLQGWDVMFLGDQLVERMRGTTNGGYAPTC